MVYQSYQGDPPVSQPDIVSRMNTQGLMGGTSSMELAQGNNNVEINPPEAEYPGEPLHTVPVPMTSYYEFLEENPKSGSLRIKAYAAQRSIPISGAQVIISKEFSDGARELFRGITDANGILDNIILPAPDKSISEHPTAALPYADYDIFVSHPNYKTEIFSNVPIFDGIKSIQPVRFVPYSW